MKKNITVDYFYYQYQHRFKIHNNINKPIVYILLNQIWLLFSPDSSRKTYI